MQLEKLRPETQVGGRRLPSGHVVLVGEGLRDISSKMQAAGLRWPWENPWEAFGDCRIGLSFPESAGGGLTPGVLVVAMLDGSGVAHIFASWEWRHVDTVVVPGMDNQMPVILQGLSALVTECLGVGIARGCIDIDRPDVARSYMAELSRLCSGAASMEWDAVADRETAKVRLQSALASGRVIMPGAVMQQIKGDTVMQRGSSGGAVERAIAALRFMFDESPHVAQQQSGRLRSLYPVG